MLSFQAHWESPNRAMMKEGEAQGMMGDVIDLMDLANKQTMHQEGNRPIGHPPEGGARPPTERDRSSRKNSGQKGSALGEVRSL